MRCKSARKESKKLFLRLPNHHTLSPQLMHRHHMDLTSFDPDATRYFNQWLCLSYCLQPWMTQRSIHLPSIVLIAAIEAGSDYTFDIMGLEQQHTQSNLSDIGRRIHERLMALESYDRLVIQAQRYELWAENLGLYQSGHSSLDYRFRDAPSIHRLTHRLLTHLEETLSTGESWCVVKYHQLMRHPGSRGGSLQWRTWAPEGHSIPCRECWP